MPHGTMYKEEKRPYDQRNKSEFNQISATLEKSLNNEWNMLNNTSSTQLPRAKILEISQDKRIKFY